MTLMRSFVAGIRNPPENKNRPAGGFTHIEVFPRRVNVSRPTAGRFIDLTNQTIDAVKLGKTVKKTILRPLPTLVSESAVIVVCPPYEASNCGESNHPIS